MQLFLEADPLQHSVSVAYAEILYLFIQICYRATVSYNFKLIYFTLVDRVCRSTNKLLFDKSNEDRNIQEQAESRSP